MEWKPHQGRQKETALLTLVSGRQSHVLSIGSIEVEVFRLFIAGVAVGIPVSVSYGQVQRITAILQLHKADTVFIKEIGNFQGLISIIDPDGAILPVFHIDLGLDMLPIE